MPFIFLIGGLAFFAFIAQVAMQPIHAPATPTPIPTVVQVTQEPTPTTTTRYIYVQPTSMPTQPVQQNTQTYQQPVYQQPSYQYQAPQTYTYPTAAPTPDYSQYNSCMSNAEGSFSSCTQTCQDQQNAQSQSGEFNQKQYNDCYFNCEQQEGSAKQACNSYPH